MWSNIDYYEVLGISPQSTDEEIKSAYRSMARRYHPDTAEQEHLTQAFRDVHEAYTTLSNPTQRAAYDRWRKEKGFDTTVENKIDLTILPSANQAVATDEPQMFYVLLDITANNVDKTAERLPLNLCLVIDHSTSMKGVRLQKVKESAREIIDRLDKQDALALVTFNDRAQVIIPSQSNINKIQAKGSLSNIQANGGTEIYHGLSEGIRQIGQWLSARHVNHIILLTDGQTYGDETQCIGLAQSARAKHISISTVGIGSDWNDKLLDQIAEISGGSSHYLARPEEISRFFAEEVEHLADILAQKVRLNIRVAHGVMICGAFRIGPVLQQLPSTEGPIELGALGAHTGQSVLLELLLPPQKAGEYRVAHFTVMAEVAAKGNTLKQSIERELHISFVKGLSELPQVPQRVLSVLNSVNIYRLQQMAALEAEEGQLDRATRRLEMVATRLLDIGEIELARATLLEAGQLNVTGTLSPEGQKKLKYGTRNLPSKRPGS